MTTQQLWFPRVTTVDPSYLDKLVPAEPYDPADPVVFAREHGYSSVEEMYEDTYKIYELVR